MLSCASCRHTAFPSRNPPATATAAVREATVTSSRSEGLDTPSPVSACKGKAARLQIVRGRGTPKNRQAPGGESLPSHQKSHQTLGGVRPLTGLPFYLRVKDESRVEAVPLVKTLGGNSPCNNDDFSTICVTKLLSSQPRSETSSQCQLYHENSCSPKLNFTVP